MGLTCSPFVFNAAPPTVGFMLAHTFSTPPPVPGWYDDPEVSGVQRWFDGTDWSTSVRPTQSQAPAVPVDEPDPDAPVAPGTAQYALLQYSFGGTVPSLPRDEDDEVASPGWYRCPVGHGWRWFNGTTWTFHTRHLRPSNLSRPPRKPTPRWARRRLSRVGATVPTVLHTSSRATTIGGMLGLVGATAALVVAGTVGWNLWGTGLQTAAAQDKLAAQLHITTSGTVLPTTAVPGTPRQKLDEGTDASAAAQGIDAQTTQQANIWNDEDNPAFHDGNDSGVVAVEEQLHTNIVPFPPPGWVVPKGRTVPSLPAENGVAVGRIQIPAIGVDQIMVTGTDENSLASGPGVWRAGAPPGSPGNSTVAGHRVTHGDPFARLNELAYGDAIYVDMPGHPQAVYEVRGRAIVTPANVAVTAPTPGVRLTLSTCHPLHSSSFRLIVQSEMVSGEWLDKSINRGEWRLRVD